jgi:hypothetical protein
VLCQELSVQDPQMIEQIEEGMLTIWFIEMDDQDAYMLKKELTYHQITDQVESHYLNLFNKEEWMLVKNAHWRQEPDLE